MLTKLSCRNFMPFTSFDLELPPVGIVHINGKVVGEPDFGNNGAGKSSVIDLIRWVLYGDFARGNIDGVINAKAKRDCEGHLTLTIRQGVTLTVSRYRKHKQFANGTHAFLNGEPLVGATAKEIQAKIDEVVGLDSDSFNRLCVFDRSMSIATIGDDDAKKLLEKLIGKIDFSRMSAFAQEKAREAAGALTSAQVRVETLKGVLASQKEQVVNQIAHRDTATRQAEASRAVLHTSIAELTARIGHEENELARLQREVSRLSESNAEFQKRLHHRSEAMRQLSKATAELDQAEAEVRHATNDKCHACGQAVPRDEARLAQAVSRADTLRKAVNHLHATMPHEVQPGAQVTQLSECSRKANEVSNQIRVLANDLNAKKAELERADGVAAHFNNQIEYLRRHVALTESQLEEAQGYLPQLSLASEVAQHVEVAFSRKGIRTHLLSVLIPSLSVRLNQYLTYLTHGSIVALISAYKGKQERFNIEVERTNGGSSYGSLSVGEKGRVDVALILTILDYLREQLPVPLVMFDELFDSLDQSGVERVVGLLREMSQTTQIFIISHSPAVTGLVDRSFTVVKEDGISRLESQ